MSWLCVLLLFVSTSGLANDEIFQIVQKSELLQEGQEAADFLQSLYVQASSHKPCAKCTVPPVGEIEKGHQLKVFISFSVPFESWKDFSDSMEKMGGVFVLRGIPGNSFAMFTQKLAELRKKGITASILIDPESFEEYGISSVPTIVLVEEGKYDKMTGNVPVQTALVAFKEKRSNQRI